MSNFHFCQFGPEHTEAEGNAEMTRGNENEEDQKAEEERFGQKS